MSEGLKGNKAKALAIAVVAVLVIAAVGVILMTSTSAVAALKLVWLDQQEQYGLDEITQLDENSNNIYASAKGIIIDGRELFTVRAYDATTGHNIWNSSWDLGAGENIATAVDAEGAYLAAAGAGRLINGTTVIMVAFYSSENGSQFWNTTFSLGGNDAGATDIVIHNTMLYVCGWARTSAGADELIVLAYDASDGVLLWHRAINNGGGDNMAIAVTASGNHVFVTGVVENATGATTAYVAALRSLDGVATWEVKYDAGEHVNKGTGILLSGNNLAVSMQCTVDGKSVMVVKGLNPVSGVERWTREETKGSAVTDMAVGGGSLVITGVQEKVFFVQALDLSSGSSMWRAEVPNHGMFNFRAAVDVEKGAVAAAFFDQNVTEEADYVWDIQVCQFKLSDGSKVFSNTTSGMGATERNIDIIIHGDKAFFSTGTEKPSIAEALALSAAGPSQVTIDGFNISVDGERFLFKGINYSPTPIGGNPDWDPNGDWFQEYWSSIPQRDLPLIKNMGVNVVKVYGMTGFTWGQDPLKSKKSHETFYETLDKYDLKLLVAVSTDLPHIESYSPNDWSANTELTNQWKTVIAEAKNHHSVIGYVVGNEINFEDKRGDATYYGKINDIMGHIKSMDPGRFTTIGMQDYSDSDGSTYDVVEMNSTMTHLDVWGINCYRGDVGQGFAELFEMYREHGISKPLLVTEFGVPGTYHDPNTDYGSVKSYTGDGVYRYIESHWTGTEKSIMNNTDICSGGFLFEYSDEWWKQGPTPGHATYVYVHDPSPFTSHPTNQRPTGWEDSEGWGLYSIAVSGGRDPMNPDRGKPDVVTARVTVALVSAMYAASHFPT